MFSCVKNKIVTPIANSHKKGVGSRYNSRDKCFVVRRYRLIRENAVHERIRDQRISSEALTVSKSATVFTQKSCSVVLVHHSDQKKASSTL
jgi:hypothetical protein